MGVTCQLLWARVLLLCCPDTVLLHPDPTSASPHVTTQPLNATKYHAMVTRVEFSATNNSPMILFLVLLATRFSWLSLPWFPHLLLNLRGCVYAQAVHSSKRRAAMTDELTLIWSLVPLHPSQNPVGWLWVLKIKMHVDDTIERYKARLVAKSYQQQYDFDYAETLSNG